MQPLLQKCVERIIVLDMENPVFVSILPMIHSVRNTLVEGSKNEFPLKHQLVRNGQPLVIPLYHPHGTHIPSTEKEDVEIDIPGPFVNDFVPAHLVLNSLKVV